jgi:hypothetical protein
MSSSTNGETSSDLYIVTIDVTSASVLDESEAEAVCAELETTVTTAAAQEEIWRLHSLSSRNGVIFALTVSAESGAVALNVAEEIVNRALVRSRFADWVVRSAAIKPG